MKKLEERLATLRHDIRGSKKCEKDLTKDLLIYICKKHINRLPTTSIKRKRLIKRLKSNAAVTTCQSYKAYGSGVDCGCRSDEGVIG